MSRRTRMLEILAAADLVPAHLEQERMRGAREAQNADRIASLAPLLVDTGVKGLGMYGEAQNAVEQAKAAQIVASHAGDDVGDKTAGAATADVLASEYPSVDDGFFADPLGYKARAREGGRAAAATGLSQAMQASKQRAEAASLDAKRIKEQRDFQQKMADDARADSINARDQARADAESERERADIRRSEDAAAKVAADERDFKQAQVLEAQKQLGRAAARSAVGAGKTPSSAKQEKDALDIEIKKTALAKAKRDEEQAAAGKPLDDAQITKLAELGNTLGLLKSVRERAGGVDTGKVQQYRNNLAQMLGISDDGTDQFRADVGEALAQYIKGISGGAVSDSERRELVRNVPTFDDSDDAFRHKTEALERRLWNLRRTQLDTLKRAKRDVRDFADFMGEYGADAAATTTTALDAAGVTKQAKLLQRVQELKGQGLSKEQARAILKREGLL